jgi:hypothetical protein
MLGVMEVPGCVLIGGCIATAYVAALEAQAQMDPVATNLQALLTAFRGPRSYVTNLIQMSTNCLHGFVSFQWLVK